MKNIQPDPHSEADPHALGSQVSAALLQAVRLEQSAISQEIRQQTQELLAYLATELAMLQKNMQALSELRERLRTKN